MTASQRSWRARRPWAGLTVLACSVLLAACAAETGPRGSLKAKDERAPSTQTAALPPSTPSQSAGNRSPLQPTAAGPRQSPRIINVGAFRYCVPHARQISSLDIRGDAWTWWRSAEGRYQRSARPGIGSILVLKKTNRLQYGHIAVVTDIVNEREILVEHANWLNQGRIHQHTPVRDVSPNNDWSVVRVWYTPGQTLGKRSYPAHGFIHAITPRRLALTQPRLQGADVKALQDRLETQGFSLHPDGVFGPATSKALIAYQRQQGLTPDGVAGPATLARLGL